MNLHIKSRIQSISDTMDIEALGILHKQKDALKALPNPSDITVKKYEDKVTKTMTSVRGDIQLVSKYSENIRTELQNVREQIKLCSVKIGEQMKELLKHNLLKCELITLLLSITVVFSVIFYCVNWIFQKRK